jgi:hypothetical protein
VERIDFADLKAFAIQGLDVQEFTIVAYGRAEQHNIRVIFRPIHPRITCR